ncbi:ABC-three component system protein [Saccharopolyspora sp. NPDC003762]
MAGGLDGAHVASTAPTLVDVPEPSVLDVSVALAGPPVSPEGRIWLYSPDEWEEFIREWVTGLEEEYVQIKRFGGAGDKGADVAAFKSHRQLEGPWDCFQAKHYVKPLSFSNAAPEILKVFIAVIGGDYRMPDTYQFLAPRGCSTELNRLLSLPTSLKKNFLARLVPNDPLARKIDAKTLDAVRNLAETTDFSLFKSVELPDALEVHSHTCFHAARFATALKPRPTHEPPPQNYAAHESRYLEQLLEVYVERHPGRVIGLELVADDPKLGKHFRRQRLAFYKAESLRVYARDSVPEGTFEKPQEDIYSGVIDTAESDHPDGYARLSSVLSQVGQLDLNRHKLITVTDNDDRKGICHQLANDDRLTWVEPS